MASKRGRSSEDGQLAREEYEYAAAQDADLWGNPGTFSRASAGTLNNRRKVVAKAKKANRKGEFVRHVKELNVSFRTWFRAEAARDGGVCLVDASRNFLDYLQQLQDRYLRTDGEVFTFGSGDCGQLAHGDDHTDVPYPRVVRSLRDLKVCIVSCGGLHNAVVTSGGVVYTWGCSDDGSLGREGEETVPLAVTLPSRYPVAVINVACGDGQTVAVAASGEVYAWGCFKDKEGKKWFSPEPGPRPEKSIKRQQELPMLVDGLAGVVDVACGGVHCIALTSSGQVLSWGIGESGELGRPVCDLKDGADGPYNMSGILNEHLTPAPMLAVGTSASASTRGTALVGVRAIGCGNYHSMVVGPQGLYTCGLNNYGQLGHGDNKNREVLTLVDAPQMDLDDQGNTDSCIQVKGGMHHSLVLMSSGRVLAFGRGDSCQLGIARFSGSSGGQAGDFQPTPEEVQVLPSAPKMAGMTGKERKGK